MKRLTTVVIVFFVYSCFSLHGNVSLSLPREYCIIGAGPSGLQIGYFFHQAQRDYVIFERSDIVGNFFSLYPRHRKLISINKRYTGKTNKEFNLRHDWNSLLSHNERLLVKHYSKDFYPHADVILKYLDDYRIKLGLTVQFNTDIRRIEQIFNTTAENVFSFFLEDQHQQQYICRTVIVAAGLWKPHAPTFEGSEHVIGYESISVNPTEFEGKTVLILGRGNSAFETADSIYGRTNMIHMISRSRARLSWNTHYVGDLRAINNGLLDNYQLKSLDGLIEVPVEQLKLRKINGKIFVVKPDQNTTGIDKVLSDTWDNFALREGYDVVIRCLGFDFDDAIFPNTSKPIRSTGRKRKYPRIKPNYESSNIPGMFFVGTVTHSLDFRRSSGGFIHGFRYTARALFRILEWKYYSVPWPPISLPLKHFLNWIIKRINEGSGIYQMFGELGDIFLLKRNNTRVEILEEYPLQLLSYLHTYAGHKAEEVIVLSMEYGENFSGPGKDTLREDRAISDVEAAYKSNFLHPVFYYYQRIPNETQFVRSRSILPPPKRIHHVLEDFLTTWTAEIMHILPLRRYLENSVNRDLRNFFSTDCLQMSLTHSTPPLSCVQGFLMGQGLRLQEFMIK
ncbi:FAD-dependent oxidoreductase domain-containing protein 2-like isoform X2 [Tachypleus tridentatus]|uniref:FAD-dependent oxidoreductase domain-containing protein 2-like isoform X2 n=1 Tax=Tachypleus tridentatus TaxID=6853 RepID=UPI003FD3330D